MSYRFQDRDRTSWIVEWRPAAAGERGDKAGLSFFAAQSSAFFVRMSKIDPAELTEEELQSMVDRAFEGRE